MIGKKQRGDTIVEVLIAMAVVSTILGGAYTAVHTSSRYTRIAQERGEALQLLQGQVERLKVSNPTQIFSSVTSPYCIDDSNNRQNLSGSIPASVNSDNWSIYASAPACRKTPQGSVEYKLAINRPTSTNNFTLYARWDGLGAVKQEVRMEYRYYP